MFVGEAAQRNVVSFGAGKIEQRGAITPFRDGADIMTSGSRPQNTTVVRDLAWREFAHILSPHQLIAARHTIPGRLREHRDQTDCIAAPAVAAGYDDARPPLRRVADNGLSLSFGHRELGNVALPAAFRALPISSSRSLGRTPVARAAVRL